MAAPAGSPNRAAASADASTTLVSVTVGVDQCSRFAGGLQAEPANRSQHVKCAIRYLLLNSRLDNRAQFTLQGSMVARGPGTQPGDDIVGRVLDGKVHAAIQFGSKMEPSGVTAE